MSLKNKLETFVKENKRISFSQVEDYCKVWGYKLSNAERRLRESEMIEPVFNEKTMFDNRNYIIGYKYKEAQPTNNIRL